jgi:phosphoribosylaminoimidazolecarboxamide formyltransferase/IMP cyclohydrolase
LTKEEKDEHMKELKGVCCSSDAFFPFPDNVHRAYRSGATYLAAPGGSIMDAECIKAADEKDIVFVHHNMRLVSHCKSSAKRDSSEIRCVSGHSADGQFHH